MLRYRVLLKVSLTALAALALVLFSQQLVDWYPEQSRWVSGFFEGKVIQLPPSTASAPPIDNIPAMPAWVDAQPAADSLSAAFYAGPVSLSGWVATEYGEVVAGETVVLHSPSQTMHYSTSTGSSGEFTFSNIKPGLDYVLKISPHGMYKRFSVSLLQILSDREAPAIALEAIPVGILVGSIIDPYNRPLGGVELYLRTLEKDLWAVTTVSDDNGGFVIENFAAGAYQLVIKSGQSLKVTGLEFDPMRGDVIN
ncbi:MAG: hypothetical protein ACI9LO_003023 [Planctomycetota bacterium]|jgi:hypothetical protein